ncbi:hypothetical protein YC2023_022068 [Brassica napus]
MTSETASTPSYQQLTSDYIEVRSSYSNSYIKWIILAIKPNPRESGASTLNYRVLLEMLKGHLYSHYIIYSNNEVENGI